MNTQHTPGNWAIGDIDDTSPDDEVTEWRVAILADGFEIGSTNNSSLEQALADAQLMIAAPQLRSA
jgi:hypothetical protein